MMQEPTSFPSPRHDHDSCIRTALSVAEQVCAARGAQFTPLRRRVLEIVWNGHAPVGAYAILEVLTNERSDGRGGAAPPTVYRALDFLLEHGLIHRIERLNAYVGCAHPERDHVGQFLICRGCGVSVELSDQDVTQAIRARATQRGFRIEAQTVELLGRCPRCQEEAP